MKLLSFKTSNGISPGVMVGNQVLDIAGAANTLFAARPEFRSMLELLEAGSEALLRVKEVVATLSEDPKLLSDMVRQGFVVDFKSLELTAPVPNPRLVLAGGMNYHAHLREMNTPAPVTPTAFFKTPSSLVGSGAKVHRPSLYPSMVDFEGEFTVVIGTHCHRVKAADAHKHVVGYTIANDVSARDKVAPVFATTRPLESVLAWEHNLLGKQFPGFCPTGPFLVTSDEIADPKNLQITTRLNGEVMQSANTSDLVYGVAELIEYFSQFIAFQPGDMLLTGSPSGVGYGRNPKVFMKDGDVVEVEVESIGVLTNEIAAPI